MPIYRQEARPFTRLSRSGPEGAARCGNADLPAQLIIFALLSFCSCLPLSATLLPCSDSNSNIVVAAAIPGSSVDLAVLLDQPASLEPKAAAVSDSIGAGQLLPPVNLHVGLQPHVREPDWGAVGMFAVGIFLFGCSWTFAAWERQPHVYRKPLFRGDQAPSPQSPHIIYSLTRTL